MSEQQLLIMHLGSVSISLLVLWVTWKRIEVGRLLLVLLFLWASYINSKTALSSPMDYLDYAQYTWSNWYREFILGYFAAHTKPLVLMIAGGQFIIAVLLSTKNLLVKIGAWGGIVFFLSIIPLGIASGFPTTLILAVAAYRITRQSFPHHLIQVIGNWVSPPQKS